MSTVCVPEFSFERAELEGGGDLSNFATTVHTLEYISDSASSVAPNKKY